MNGSEEGRGEKMEYNDGRYDECGVEKRGRSNDKDKRNKRVRSDKDEDSESDEERQESLYKEIEKYEVVIRFSEKSQAIMKKVSPFVLTSTLANKIGEIEFAKILNDGNLFVRCANAGQMDKALKIKDIAKCKVENSGRVGTRKKDGKIGVITGVPLSVNMEELKKNIKGAKILSVQRMKTKRDGVVKDSETVSIEFEEESVPKKVFLGFMSYPVRMFVPKPMRCFNCQRFGHTAKNCKRQKRCARCGGDHDYGLCGSGISPKCCNCGGAHNVAFSGCEVMRRETNIQKIRVEKRITYAEAVKVTRERENKTHKEIDMVVQEQQQSVSEGMYVKKMELVTFIAGVINSTAEVKSKNEKIQLVVKAAVNHLGLVGLTWEEVREILTNQSSQEVSCIG